ncbi:uncharacterized protein PFL1_02080 [Pseudozyma flocculosa PF-1]|uniref:uncharacterized protein n=1 Tax=Pseudozyma flocculosa PF-1 TaxID=1277687 RepID=UPI000456128B|nr:uncharacterized protein PFL1_02080 [Pseudozyma flocculosa PF-1]EPQ30555.1 hypothetical protein PFL1_02080 [Pseudozyma flocculosa PF-1]
MSYPDHHDYYPPPTDVYSTGGPKGYMPAMDSTDSLTGRRGGEKDYDSDAWGMSAGGGYYSGDSSAYYRSGAPHKGRKKMWWIIGAVALAVIGIGAGVGIYLAKRGDNSSSGSASGAVKSDPNDPSKFDKDPRLHQSLYGLCYTPLNSQLPSCGDTLEQVIEDVQIMSQLTKRIRTYGADCDVPALVLEAIAKTKVDMEVFLAVWVDDNAVTYKRQVDSLTAALKQHGADHVAGVIVGNEVLLNGGSVSDLVSKMSDMRTTLAGLGLSKTPPVGTSDAGSMMTAALGEGSDFVFSNTHPWFGGTLVSDAAGWTWSYTHNQEPSTVLSAPNKPTVYVGEVGWPTGANETRLETYEGAVAGVPQLQTFLDTFVCESNTNITAGTGQPYFYFEAFDEPWKDAQFGGVEAHWGLFTKDKKLKDGITIPTCISP